MYGIVYKPRTTIKAKILSDFLAEWTGTQTPPKEQELEYWTINFEGSLQLQGAGTGILVTSPKGENFKYFLQMYFPSSNNAAEYKAQIHGLRIATTLSIHPRHPLTQSSWGLIAHCQPVQQRVVMFGRQNDVVLSGAPQTRKQF
jgi:hypothetical protein